jgi:hypothetical protein
MKIALVLGALVALAGSPVLANDDDKTAYVSDVSPAARGLFDIKPRLNFKNVMRVDGLRPKIDNESPRGHTFDAGGIDGLDRGWLRTNLNLEWTPGIGLSGPPHV